MELEDKVAIVTEGWKLIRNLDDSSFELYDLVRDPHEIANRWDEEDAELRSVRDRLTLLEDEVAFRLHPRVR